MYEFKLRINIFGWLILALILALLLWHFIPVASAAESDMYYYDGVELPDINSVWTDKSTYPCVLIYSLRDGYFLRFAQKPTTIEIENGSTKLFDARGYEFIEYSLDTNSHTWVFTISGTNQGINGFYASANSSVLRPIWANYDILHVDGTLYLAASDPVPVDPGPSSAVVPVFTVQPPLITWVEYNVGDTPTPVSVEAVVDDGGTISYTWYRVIFPESGSPSNVVFSAGSTLVPDTSVVSYSSYYCVATYTNGEFSRSAYSRAYRVKVVESGATDPPSETPTYPSAEDIGSSVGDAFQGVLDQNDVNTSEQGNSFVDQITQIVPNVSQGFVNAMGGLVDSLSYGGTECVLTVPALVMPQIGDLVPQYTLLEKQTVDLESYFNMFPSFIVTLVQSLFTVALIVFCFKELYSTVSYFFVLRGGET